MSPRIRAALALSAVTLLAACAKKDEAPKDTVAAMTPAPAAAAAPAPIALADFTGDWKIAATPEAGSDTSTNFTTLHATADSTWILETATGLKIPHHVTLSGDSVLLKSDTYASLRRKGKKVWTEGVVRLQDGKLVGTTIGHYQNAGPDSVLRMRTVGTKQ